MSNPRLKSPLSYEHLLEITGFCAIVMLLIVAAVVISSGGLSQVRTVLTRVVATRSSGLTANIRATQQGNWVYSEEFDPDGANITVGQPVTFYWMAYAYAGNTYYARCDGPGAGDGYACTISAGSPHISSGCSPNGLNRGAATGDCGNVDYTKNPWNIWGGSYTVYPPVGTTVYYFCSNYYYYNVFGGCMTQTVNTAATPTVVNSFSANPSVVGINTPTTLSYNATPGAGGTSLSIYNATDGVNYGNTAGWSGTFTTPNLPHNTTFYLYPHDTYFPSLSPSQTTVTAAAPVAASMSFSATDQTVSSMTISAGQSATVYFRADSATPPTQCQVYNSFGVLKNVSNANPCPSSANQSYTANSSSPTFNTNTPGVYTISFSYFLGAWNSVTTLTLTILPSCSLTATPTSAATSGSTVTLTYGSSGATSGTITGPGLNYTLPNNTAGSQQGPFTYTYTGGTGTYTTPAGWDQRANSEYAIGGGGGGGGAPSGNPYGGGSGAGGGAYSSASGLNVPAGTQVSYYVGAGGTGGGTNISGSAGQATWFYSTSYLDAGGGGGGAWNPPGSPGAGGTSIAHQSGGGFNGGGGGGGCYGGGGGGGAAGPRGPGGPGGSGCGGNYTGGGGGGGADNGSSGGNNFGAVSGNGGTSGASGVGGAGNCNNSGAPANGGGGSGGYGASCGGGVSSTESYFASGYGPSGGGGGGGNGCSTAPPGCQGRNGGTAASFGGGAGGGGSTASGGGNGGNGLLVIYYTPYTFTANGSVTSPAITTSPSVYTLNLHDSASGQNNSCSVSIPITDVCSDISGFQPSGWTPPSGCQSPVGGQCVPNGYQWNGSICVQVTPTLNSFTAPLRVGKGETTPLYYNVTNPPSSCTITGTNGYSTSVSPLSGVTGQVTTTGFPINAPTNFTLTCGSVKSTLTIGVAPSVIEK